jgi:hypothetical protein
MNGFKWVWGCAAFGLIAALLGASASAQDDPFGDGKAPAGPAAKGQAQAEKSLLTEKAMPAVTADDSSPPVWQYVGEGDPAAVTRIENALSGKLRPTGIDFTDSPLQDVVTQLQDDYQIPIQLDKPALEEAGIGTDEKVTVSLHNISLRSALRLMLKQLQLTYIIQDEVLLITTKEQAEANLRICVYDIRGLVDEGDSKAIDALMETIIDCVATETWAKNGGGQAEIRAVSNTKPVNRLVQFGGGGGGHGGGRSEGGAASIRPIKPRLLVISQTQAVHEEIQNLFETIRHMRQDSATDAKAAAKRAAQNEPGSEVVTRSYLLQLNPATDIPALRNQVRDLITGSLPDEVWNGRLDDGQAVSLTVFNDRIVVRHTPAAQEKLQKILVDSGVAIPAPEMSGMGGMPGGGFGGRGPAAFRRGGFGGQFGPGGPEGGPADATFAPGLEGGPDVGPSPRYPEPSGRPGAGPEGGAAPGPTGGEAAP